MLPPASSKIADRIRQIPRSGIRDFFELVQGRNDVISLGVGEPDFATPWHIREAAIFALERGETCYTSNLGLLLLRRRISNYIARHCGVSYDPLREIIVTVGVSEALDLAFRALLNPGDEVIYHEPCYVSYNPGIYMAGGVPVAVPTRPEDDFILRAADVERVITPRTKALMLNFPTNPTGAFEPEAELESIAALAVQHDLIVLTDEIYSELLYDGHTHTSLLRFPGMRERTVLLHGFSKAYAMTGWRLGYACAPGELIEAMMKIHQYAMLCAPIMSQRAAVEALENGADSVAHMRESYELRRNLVLGRLNAMGLPTFRPGGAFYVFPDIRGTGLSSKEFAVRLVNEQNVAVVPGSAFGPSGEGFVRCCYATALPKLETALERMTAFVGELQAVAA
ncbi:MAG: aminotransferase class I/II-fold pyridoxal phosphate-dependent enzyme [Verrucomicrobiales bacterium]